MMCNETTHRRKLEIMNILGDRYNDKVIKDLENKKKRQTGYVSEEFMRSLGLAEEDTVHDEMSVV